jgi:hypothetical protein
MMARNSDEGDRPAEKEAVYTTIVGGRPPGCGTEVGNIPRGIEIMVKKAAVDAEFKALLLEKRAGAAEDIKLELDPAEAAMLTAIPAAQLEAIVAGTKVDEKVRPAFLGRVAAIMIAALGVGAAGCATHSPVTEGVRPDHPQKIEPAPEQPGAPAQKPSPDQITRGIRPDRIPVTDGIRPDRPMTKGIRPDRPPTSSPARDAEKRTETDDGKARG